MADPDDVLNKTNITTDPPKKNQGGRPLGRKDQQKRKDKGKPEQKPLTKTQAKKEPLADVINTLSRETINRTVLKNSKKWGEKEFNETDCGPALLMFISKYIPADPNSPGFQVFQAAVGVAIGTAALIGQKDPELERLKGDDAPSKEPPPGLE